VQLLNPLSTLFSFFILLAAGTTALGAYGACCLRSGSAAQRPHQRAAVQPSVLLSKGVVAGSRTDAMTDTCPCCRVFLQA
jgi:hypothetical protein